MTTTTKEIIFEEGKGNYWAENVDYVAGNDSITCEEIIYTTDAALVDSHSITARHKRPKLLLIKGRS